MKKCTHVFIDSKAQNLMTTIHIDCFGRGNFNGFTVHRDNMQFISDKMEKFVYSSQKKLYYRLP